MIDDKQGGNDQIGDSLPPSEPDSQDAGLYADPGPAANSGVPAVAAGGTKNVMILALVVVVAGIFLFNIFSGEEAPEQQQSNARNIGDVDNQTADLPEPPPPIPSIPSIPPPPPPPPSLNTGADLEAQTGADQQNATNMKALSLPPERVKSSMVVSGGGAAGPQDGAAQTLEGGVAGENTDNVLANTSAAQVNATLAGEPINMVAQGKIIDAVLETAINTDLSGILRAVVSRDVYAEAGKRILIPKGSRLIGTYDVSVKRGQSRIFIVWNRVLRPDGVDVLITSPGSDRLGRAGVDGNVDSKYLEIFSNAILFSSMTVAFAFGAEKAINADGLSERENTSGSVTTSGKPSDVAVVEAIDDFGDVVKTVAQEVVDMRPTITIDQGTRMKVFVNKDLKFPSVIQSDVVFIK